MRWAKKIPKRMSSRSCLVSEAEQALFRKRRPRFTVSMLQQTGVSRHLSKLTTLPQLTKERALQKNPTKKGNMLTGTTTGVVVILATVLVVVHSEYSHQDDTLFQWDEDGHPLMHTTMGTLRGVREHSFGGRPFLSFYAIPYARPPLGILRFHDPVRGKAWRGVRNATSQPERCLQISFKKAKSGIISEEHVEGTEDCLYLNVFVPEAATVKKVDADEGLPVMVFLHGGGFVGGAAQEHEPYVLVDQDVILIVPQFRLGIFGFLSTEDDVISGNYMLKDQVEALRWVQRHIRVFGGDPNRVMIFGESAGGISTNLLAISPKAKGLFSRAALHSGTALASFNLGNRFRQVAEETASTMGHSGKFDSRSILSFLQTVPGKSLTLDSYKYYEWFTIPNVWGPRVDGDLLPSDPYKLQLKAACPHYQLMTGLTAHDGAIMTHHFYQREELRTRMKENFSYIGPLSLQLSDDPDPMTKTNAIYKYYLGENIDFELSENYTQLVTDYCFGVPSDLVAQAHAACAQPRKETFIFTLTHRGEQSASDILNITIGKEWVTHLDDLIYLFPVEALIPGGRRLTRPEDLALREIMTKLWVNFATTGNPTPDDSLGFTWEAVEGDNLKYLALAPHPAMQPDPRRQVRDFYRTVLPHQNELVENLLKLEEGTR